MDETFIDNERHNIVHKDEFKEPPTVGLMERLIVKMRNVARATRRDSLPTVPSSPRPITFLAFDLLELKYVVAFALP